MTNSNQPNQGFYPMAKLAIKKRQLIKKLKLWRKLWINRYQKNPTLQESNHDKKITYKEQLSYLYQVELDSFLLSDKNLSFPSTEKPLVSIILVLHNRAELTFQCLRSLMTVTLNAEHPCEIILVDNASQDQTNLLLERLCGVTKILNRENCHFLAAINQASKVAKGSYLLLLNNDAQILPGTLSAALDTYSSANDIGAVGGKIIFLDGQLQEAGSIIWNDGSCLGYGRGGNPFDYPYMFRRDVDYCSGAFLLTERNLFLEMGGFDEDYKPAYYEETDYCLRLWEQGKRVVYEPNAAIVHFEFASAQSNDSAINLQKAHQSIFTQKHSQQLANYHLPPAPENIVLARSHSRNSNHILYIDDRVPHAFLGSGFPRSRDILQALVDLNYCVTFYPLGFPEESWQEAYEDIPKVVELVLHQGIEGLEEFLNQRAHCYDLIFISRPHNMEILNPILNRNSQWFEKTRIIYDAEAIYALREVKKRQLLGKTVSQNEKKLLVQTEMQLAENADTVITVSEKEQEHFTNAGVNSVYTLGHTVDLKPTAKKFEERTGIVFVGAIHNINSPNADSVVWFAKEVFPLLQEKIGNDLTFKVVGFNKCQKIWDLQSDSLQVLGKVESLEEIYNCARVFVAPTRFAAGIPFKVHHAAAYGLPIVTTSMIASQIGWEDQQEVLVGDDPKTFAEKCTQVYFNQKLWESLRNAALNKIQLECSRDNFVQKVETIIKSQ
ncbi:glycosyltransferase [Euhalothece natronophila Z-M001]|uniref:Glycosyltransferase n=1 Tax=Euhalothece natronophila Z-M001 TaxID=522448 RepID=A0A5B8NJH5_9CHRO|nr:glycosyltransferase [Euhalothece natronophila]QDZ38661.1 glycosyltransferase [Euhalothece natronophila Z-M001]